MLGVIQGALLFSLLYFDLNTSYHGIVNLTLPKKNHRDCKHTSRLKLYARGRIISTASSLKSHSDNNKRQVVEQCREQELFSPHSYLEIVRYLIRKPLLGNPHN